MILERLLCHAVTGPSGAASSSVVMASCVTSGEALGAGEAAVSGMARPWRKPPVVGERTSPPMTVLRYTSSDTWTPVSPVG